MYFRLPWSTGRGVHDLCQTFCVKKFARLLGIYIYEYEAVKGDIGNIAPAVVRLGSKRDSSNAIWDARQQLYVWLALSNREVWILSSMGSRWHDTLAGPGNFAWCI